MYRLYSLLNLLFKGKELSFAHFYMFLFTELKLAS
nr:MAG TPA: hypothetical protein [Caudoviricetes sp.]